jgi:hypothetical protein
VSTRPDTARRRSLIVVITIAALVAAMALVETASAAPSAKPFRVDVDGAVEPVAVGSTASIQVTISNDSSTLTIGSSDVVAPAGYVLPEQVVSLPQGTATVAGGTIQLRAIGLKPLTSLVVTFSAIVPCEGDGPWSVDAKRSLDHSGVKDFVLDAAGSDLLVGPVGRCHLAFDTSPASAEFGSSTATESEPITGTAYDPSGPSVAVEVLDGAGQRITTSSAAIALTLGGGTAGAGLALNGSSDVSVGASSGLATFSVLTIDEPGFDYTLTASSAGLDPAVSGPFNIALVGQICEGGSCDAPATSNPSNSGTGAVHATDVPPNLELAVAFTGDDPCAGTGYVPVMPDTFTVLALDGGEPSSGVTLEITLEIFKQTLAGRRLGDLKVCFATDVAGKTFIDANGAQVSQGLLPLCSIGNSLNCVVSKTKDRGTGNVTVVFRVLDGRGKT